MRRGLVLGNWKLNGNRADNEALLCELLVQLDDADQVDIGVCPPFPYLEQAATLLVSSCIAIGAQNVALAQVGAFTGEVSADMLADLGCRYVIVGHSERRALFGETSAMVAKKFARVLQANLTPVLCVGETLAQREAGEALAVVGDQLRAVIDEVGFAALQDSAIAYEPVWAIGTGKTASPAQAQEVHAFLRGLLEAGDEGVANGMRILYGGSVSAATAQELFSMADIDGALVGGASLRAGEFSAIARAAGL